MPVSSRASDVGNRSLLHAGNEMAVDSEGRVTFPDACPKTLAALRGSTPDAISHDPAVCRTAVRAASYIDARD